jgi:predicted CXXCH cytochrome family protein
VRRLALLIAGGAVWLLLAAPAFADNGPHRANAGTTPDSCAGCHRAHTAQSPKLLGVLVSNPQDLCLSCHGNGGTGATTNVQGGQQYQATDTTVPGAVTTVIRGTTVAGALRGGGFETAWIDSANPVPDPVPYGPGLTVGILTTVPSTGNVYSMHDVDGTSDAAWGMGDIGTPEGYGIIPGLTCTSCHNPHGNGQYRILKPTPTGAYTGGYSGFTSPIASMSNITIPDASAYVYTTTNYWQVKDASQPAYAANVSKWCASCHTRYLAGGDSEIAPSGDAIFSYRHRTDGDGTEGLTALSNPPTCIKCHVSHGSNAQVGLNSDAINTSNPQVIP